MGRETLKTGQVVVAYDYNTNQCFEGQVTGVSHVENARFCYAIYSLLIDDEVVEYKFDQVFSDRDLDAETQELHSYPSFEVDAKYHGIELAKAKHAIAQALIALK